MQALETYRHWLVGAFFGAYFLLGLWVLPDYGVGWDEPNQRNHGIVTVDYLNSKFGWYEGKFKPEADLLTYEFRHYGMLFQMACFAVERWLGLESFRENHLLRHYGVFLVFWLGSIAFYRWLLHRYRNWRWALLGTLLLVLSPRIFAHSFFNIKDSILLASYAFGSLTLWNFFEKRNWQTAVLHGLGSALAINARIVGVFLPAITLAWLALDFLLARQKWGHLRKNVPLLAVYAVSLSALTVLFWPYLWENPVGHLKEAFEVMGKYEWGGEVLIWGERFWARSSLPWWYAPSWILVTVPVLYTVLALSGMTRIVGGFFRRTRPWISFGWYADRERRFDAMALSLFLLPILIVIYKNSTLYDGWRQLHFVYPPFVALAMSGLAWWTQKLRPAVVWTITALCLAITAGHMIRIHPYQQASFNFLAGENRLMRFDQDYWGISYKQAYEELLRRDARECFTVYGLNFPAEANYYFLPDYARQHIRFLNGEDPDADYYLTNYRGHWDRDRYNRKKGPFKEELFAITVDGTKILGVYKLK